MAKQRIHILGIAGTFMGSLALLARAMGYEVSGRDRGVYPPMSDQLAAAGIQVEPDMDAPLPDDAEIIVGNVMRRDMPVINQLLERVGRFYSGPQWLGERILSERFVLAVSGTHGKTTTASMTAHILEYAGLKPGFLIGGVPGNFPVSARLGDSPFFVIEADEYDTAFFDKRAKFVHYRPRGVVVNNIEFDHADIYPNLAAIEQQFAYFLRLVPDNGLVIAPQGSPAVDQALHAGCYAPVLRFADRALPADQDGLVLQDNRVYLQQQNAANVDLGCLPDNIIGRHNQHNALAALGLARFAGVPAEVGMEALAQFSGVARRLQLIGNSIGVRVFDDFAHHPTAISATLTAARSLCRPPGRVVAVLDPRSNSMRQGAHKARLAEALAQADLIFIYTQGIGFDIAASMAGLGKPVFFEEDLDCLLSRVAGQLQTEDVVISMSNAGFGQFPQRLFSRLDSSS